MIENVRIVADAESESFVVKWDQWSYHNTPSCKTLSHYVYGDTVEELVKDVVGHFGGKVKAEDVNVEGVQL